MPELAQRAAKKKTTTSSSSASSGGMAGAGQSHDFPVLFTIDGSNRHEIILVNPGLDLSQLRQAVEALLESPNCAEVLSKYRSKEKSDEVAEVRVKWSSYGRDGLFPVQTILTEENVEPVLRMMAVNVGKDKFDVKLAQKSGGGGDGGGGDSSKSTSEAPKK